MMSLPLKILTAGIVSGILANVTGYLITGRLFHGYQAKTPNTWRATESWVHYQYAALIRIGACIAVAFAFAALKTAVPPAGSGPLSQGALFGLILWTVIVLPLVVEVALFVNWHRGFVIGLLLDWLVVCVLAGASAAAAIPAG